jgi:hypothetical protein
MFDYNLVIVRSQGGAGHRGRPKGPLRGLAAPRFADLIVSEH